MSYWITVEYIGAGFVIQRLVDNDGADNIEYNHDGGYSACERVVHIRDTDSIDTSSIDVSHLPEE